MTVLTRQMHKSFDQSVVSIGVTRSQWTMIAVIARRPAATQREIAEILEMSEASAGRLVDRLVADGLLERRQKEDDRRAYCIHLTDSAGALLDKISAGRQRARKGGLRRLQRRRPEDARRLSDA
jgi:MarR family transcriptional regulator for hemolysin